MCLLTCFKAVQLTSSSVDIGIESSKMILSVFQARVALGPER